MNLKLVKMNEEEFDQYLEFLMLDYAQDLSENFLIPLDKATEESKVLRMSYYRINKIQRINSYSLFIVQKNKKK